MSTPSSWDAGAQCPWDSPKAYSHWGFILCAPDIVQKELQEAGTLGSLGIRHPEEILGSKKASLGSNRPSGGGTRRPRKHQGSGPCAEQWFNPTGLPVPSSAGASGDYPPPQTHFSC